MYPSETEILFALGLGDKIYGVSDFDDYPKEALTKPKVGGVTKPNEEAIIAANPDLVIGGISMKDDIVEKFRGLDLPLYKTEPKKMDDILNNIIQIGIITNTQQKAEELVAQMKEDIKTVTEAAATLKEVDKKKVYIEFSPGWTLPSSLALFSDLLSFEPHAASDMLNKSTSIKVNIFFMTFLLNFEY